jgi:hypothetical protein
MLFHIIYLVNFKENNDVVPLSTFSLKNSAVNNIEIIAVDYVKEQHGKRQSLITLQLAKSVDEIRDDENLKEGYYIRKESENYVLYEKARIKLEGVLWDSYKYQMERTGLFGIMEYDVNDTMLTNTQTINQSTDKETMFGSLIKRQKNIKDELQKKVMDTQHSLINELKIRLSVNDIKLKPVKKNE